MVRDSGVLKTFFKYFFARHYWFICCPSSQVSWLSAGGSSVLMGSGPVASLFFPCNMHRFGCCLARPFSYLLKSTSTPSSTCLGPPFHYTVRWNASLLFSIFFYFLLFSFYFFAGQNDAFPPLRIPSAVTVGSTCTRSSAHVCVSGSTARHCQTVNEPSAAHHQILSGNRRSFRCVSLN